MAKYILVKKVKGKKYEYQVIDADSEGDCIKKRTPREYVGVYRRRVVLFRSFDLIGN